MSKLFAMTLAVVVLSISIASISCDDYNIVEPRFYSEKDVVELGDCSWGTYSNSVGATDKMSIVSTPLDASFDYSVHGCWHNGQLYVRFVTPESGRIKVTIQNSAGGVVLVVHEGHVGAAVHQMVWGIPWEDKDAGVYGLSLQTWDETVVVWFEVN